MDGSNCCREKAIALLIVQLKMQQEELKMSKQLEENVNSLIINFLENGGFLENPLNESKLNFEYLKINDPILADNIFNFRIESYGQVELQEWDVVRSDEIVNMDELYMEKNNDIDGLTTKIFNFVGKK